MDIRVGATGLDDLEAQPAAVLVVHVVASFKVSCFAWLSKAVVPWSTGSRAGSVGSGTRKMACSSYGPDEPEAPTRPKGHLDPGIARWGRRGFDPASAHRCNWQRLSAAGRQWCLERGAGRGHTGAGARTGH